MLERRDCYRLRTDAWENVLRTRLAAIASAKGLADEGLWLLGDGEHPARARLESLREFSELCASFERELPSFLERLRRSNTRARRTSPLPR